MKKVYALLLLFAVMGGLQLITSEKKNPSSSDFSITEQNKAHISQENDGCLGLRKKLERSLDENESLSSVFYSPINEECMYEKQRETEGGVTLFLVDVSDGEIAKWSSEEDGYQDFKELVNIYRDSKK